MLAINGGKPVRDSFLQYGKQWIDDNDIEQVVETLRSSFLTQGPKVVEFEEKIAAYVGSKYAVSFCNGTAALHAACFAANIGNGDEVITSPITFVASSNCVLYTGGRPVFVDIDERTYNIDPNKIEQAITPQTKAILAVDFSGQPVALNEIRYLADKYGLVLIEDAAHALGATYKGRKIGSLADMTMFSFHPVKPITTAEGGVIVTDSSEYARKLRLFRSHGITNIPEEMNRTEGAWYYEMQELGMNYRLTDVQATLGISQLNKLDHFLAMRRKWATLYTEFFSQLDGILTPYQLPETDSGWHLYILRLKLEKFNVSRRQIFEALRAENIGVHVHYIPVYLQPYYKKIGYCQGLCPIGEQWYEEVLTLPLYSGMTKEDVFSVIEAVEKVLRFYRI